jgi:hypothetical protein
MISAVDKLIQTKAIIAYVNNLVKYGFAARARFVAPKLIWPNIDWITVKDTKVVITDTFVKTFDTIISRLYSIHPDARQLLVLNIRKLAVIFKALLAAREKKNKRPCVPDPKYLVLDNIPCAYVEESACQALQNWLTAKAPTGTENL